MGSVLGTSYEANVTPGPPEPEIQRVRSERGRRPDNVAGEMLAQRVVEEQLAGVREHGHAFTAERAFEVREEVPVARDGGVEREYRWRRRLILEAALGSRATGHSCLRIDGDADERFAAERKEAEQFGAGRVGPA